jgi:hypothetical protein
VTRWVTHTHVGMDMGVNPYPPVYMGDLVGLFFCRVYGYGVVKPGGYLPIAISTLKVASASPDPRARPHPRPRKVVSASPDPRARPHPRPRKVVSASPDPRARPQPRPWEDSRPRPTSASGAVSASPDLGLGPTTPQGIHHYPTPS